MKDIISEVYRKVLSFFNNETKEENSKDTACNRLKLVLMQDRAKMEPALMEKMREEMIEVISKYVEIDKEALDLNLEAEGESFALMLNIPVLRAKTREEIEAAEGISLDDEDDEEDDNTDINEEEEEEISLNDEDDVDESSSDEQSESDDEEEETQIVEANEDDDNDNEDAEDAENIEKDKEPENEAIVSPKEKIEEENALPNTETPKETEFKNSSHKKRDKKQKNNS